jgi:hypothetical protein
MRGCEHSVTDADTLVLCAHRTAPRALSFKHLPEEEQVALVERLLRRALAVEASSAAAKGDTPPPPPPLPSLLPLPVPVPATLAPSARLAADAPVAAIAPDAPAAPEPPVRDAAAPEPSYAALDDEDGWNAASSSSAPALPPMLGATPSGVSTTSPPARAAAGWPWQFAAPVAFGAAALGFRALLRARAQQNGASAPLPQSEAADAGVAGVSAPVDVRAQSDAQAVSAASMPPTSSGGAASPQPRASQTPDEPLPKHRPATGALWVRKDDARAPQNSPAGAAAAAGVPARVLWQRAAKRVPPAADSARGVGDQPPAAEASGAAAGWSGDREELTDNVEGLRIGAAQRNRGAS